MQSGNITDSAITASSSANPNSYAPYVGRLHFLSSGSGKYGSWAAGANNLNQWFQVDFGSWAQISAVLTQGRQDSNQWVKSYSLSYSYDGVFFKTYTNEHGLKQVITYRNVSKTGTFFLSILNEASLLLLGIIFNCLSLYIVLLVAAQLISSNNRKVSRLTCVFLRCFGPQHALLVIFQKERCL